MNYVLRKTKRNKKTENRGGGGGIQLWKLQITNYKQLGII